jgi:hypothetical protein
MPSFCRHNRLVQNCPICSREQAVELRPVVTSSTPKASLPRPATPAGRGADRSRSGVRTVRSNAGGVRVRRLARGVDDGYQSPLLPGLKSSGDADRLAQEIAFAATRLEMLEGDPPGLCAVVADPAGDLEERTWLAFLIAYLCPLDDADPYAEIASVRTSWASGELPDLDGVRTGPRTAHVPERGSTTIEAYRAWAARAGSQAAAFIGEASWMPERRFARAFERLALPGMHRDARYELLVLLGWLGCYEMRAGALQLGGDNETTVAAKRALGIGDSLLLDRRAADLAGACGVALEALDLALYNWGTGERTGLGLPLETEPDDDVLSDARTALGL